MTEQVTDVVGQNREMRDSLDKRQTELTELAEVKCDWKEVDAQRDKVTVALKRIDFRLEELKNEALSLENWVEKYMPLRL